MKEEMKTKRHNISGYDVDGERRQVRFHDRRAPADRSSLRSSISYLLSPLSYLLSPLSSLLSPLSSLLSPISSLLSPISYLLFPLLLASCGLFDTRQPENPVNAGSNFETPTTPSVVLRNMESALNSANASDYRKCFSDTTKGLPPFIFIPSTQGLSAAPTKFTTWGIIEEETYIQNIFAELQQGGVCSVTFTPGDVTDVPISDSVQFDASYRVSFPHTNEAAERDAEGLLHFTFRLSRQNEWYISSWRDIAVENKPSWSLIKARFVDR